MSSEFEQNLEKDAELAVKVGLNIQSGQRLLIGAPTPWIKGAPIQAAPLVRLIATYAYRAGARLVDVLWNDEQLQLARYKYAPRDSFEEYPTWQTNGALEYAKRGDARLVIWAQDPDLLKDQDPELVATIQQTPLKLLSVFCRLPCTFPEAP